MSARVITLDASAAEPWLTAHACEIVGRAADARAAVRLAKERRADLVVASARLGREVAELLWASAPGVGCVVLGQGVRGEERAMVKAGALEVLPRALEGQAAAARLDAALAEVRRRREVLAAERPGEAAVTGKLVAVLSAKGGVGRSFAAANLASWLAERESAVLVDLDLQFGDVSRWGNEDGVPDRSIDQLGAVVASGEIRLEDVRAVGRMAFGKVTLLPGTRSPVDGAAWAQDRGLRTLQLVHSLRRWFRWTVVDGLAGLIEPMVGVARAADVLIVVTGPDVGTIRATQRYLAMLDRYAPRPRLVIVNRADRGEPRELIESALAGERLTWVKEDRAFARRLVLEGRAATDQAGSGVARSLRDIARTVAVALG